VLAAVVCCWQHDVLAPSITYRHAARVSVLGA
jgi:hypothetical protein